jgi:tetratricopeptide (TPR) repeat protein
LIARALALSLLASLGLARATLAQPLVDPDTEVARKHFEKGSEHYRAGHYDLALEEFEASRRAKKLPAFDYNIGRCLDRLERYADAVAAYRRYVDAAPFDTDAPDVKARIAELEARLAEGRPSTSSGAETPRPKPRWLWGLIGGAAAVVVVAIVIGVVVGTRGPGIDTWPDVNFR